MKLQLTCAAALPLLVLLGACKDSGSPGPGLQPGVFDAGTLPDDFAIFLSERSEAGRVEPFLADAAAGDVRSLGAFLPSGARLGRESTAVSPNGRILGVTYNVTSAINYAVVAASDGTSRRLPFTTSTLEDGGGAPGRFVFSPDSSRVLFSYQDNATNADRTYLMRPDATDIREVGQSGNRTRIIGWTPDSAFFYSVVQGTATFDEVLRVYSAADLSFVDFVPVAPTAVCLDSAMMSDDGSTVGLGIYYELAGGGPGVLRAAAVRPATSEVVEFVTPDVDSDFVIPSPDGDYVTFVTESSAAMNQVEVYIGNVATGTAALASVAAPVANSDAWALTWEPTGNRLLYLANHVDLDIEELFVTGPTTPTTRVMTGLVSGDEVKEFKWSPTGRFAAFTLRPDGTSTNLIHLFDADSGTVEALDFGAANGATGFEFSPDGNRLLVGATTPGVAEAHLFEFNPNDLSVVPVDHGVVSGAFGNPNYSYGYGGFYFELGGAVSVTKGSDAAFWIRRRPGGGGDQLMYENLSNPTGATVLTLDPVPAASGAIEGVLAR